MSSAGLQDFISGFKLWKLAIYLGWEDIHQRYVRTFLGPMWLTLGNAVWIGVMAFVMASLFGNSIADTLPFIAAGTLLWTFISNVMNEGCTLFITSSNIITNVNLPVSLHVLRFVVRNFFIFLHNFIVLVTVFVFCKVKVDINTLLAIPALLIIVLNAVWVGTLLGIANTRYRDIQQLIVTSMTILPFVTPIFWDKAFLKKHFWIANINPFYHAVEIFRAPLLGYKIPVLSWQIMLALTFLGTLFTLKLFNKFRHRIIYWL